MIVLAIDIGGSHVKALAQGHDSPSSCPPVPTMTRETDGRAVRTAVATVEVTRRLDRISRRGAAWQPVMEPRNLGQGWVGFDFKKAFGCPVKVINDAAMQALGSYRGGRMLFLGLGTGLGSALIIDGVLEPMELAHLPYKKGRTYEDYVGNAGLKRLGKKKWRRTSWT